jgi:intracellular septation protein A
MTDPSPAEGLPERVEVSVRNILLGSGPRFARDAFGPVLAFYVGYKVFGLVVGIVAATIVATAAWLYERRCNRPGLIARLALVIIVVQALIGLLAGDARAYFAPAVLTTFAWGLAFVGSVVIGRPLAGVFAGEMYPFPPEVRASATFTRVFSIISLGWGTVMLLRAGLRLLILLTASIDAFVGVSAATGAPLTAAMITWSVWYAARAFRRSEEWGWALTGS